MNRRPGQTGRNTGRARGRPDGKGAGGRGDSAAARDELRGIHPLAQHNGDVPFRDFPDPVTKEAKRNLVAAKQTIDILNILEAKTKGNLDEDEKQLMEGILYELRMRYVKEMSSK